MQKQNHFLDKKILLVALADFVGRVLLVHSQLSYKWIGHAENFFELITLLSFDYAFFRENYTVKNSKQFMYVYKQKPTYQSYWRELTKVITILN